MNFFSKYNVNLNRKCLKHSTLRGVLEKEHPMPRCQWKAESAKYFCMFHSLLYFSTCALNVVRWYVMSSQKLSHTNPHAVEQQQPWMGEALMMSQLLLNAACFHLQLEADELELIVASVQTHLECVCVCVCPYVISSWTWICCCLTPNSWPPGHSVKSVWR